MSTAQPLAAAEARVIPIDARRSPRAKSRHAIKVAAALALGLFALIGSFADSAIARTGLLLMGSPDADTGNLDGLAATLIWATVANIAACAGVVMIVYWLLSRPSAQIVELRPRRYKA